MFQTFLNVAPPPISVGLLRNDPILLTFSIILSVMIFSSAIITIRSSFIYRKKLLYVQKHKKLFLILAIIIALSTLTWIIMMEVFYMIYGANHWIGIGVGHYIPHFGVIGPFIGTSLIIIGVLLDKNVGSPNKLKS